MYAPIPPGIHFGGPGIPQKEVVHGRRDLSRTHQNGIAHTSAYSGKHDRTNAASHQQPVNQIRTKELNRTGNTTAKGDNTGNTGTTVIPERSGVRNSYRQSSNHSAKNTQSTNRNNGNATYQYNRGTTHSQSSSSGNSYSSGRSNYQSGYSGGSSRSSGTTSSSGGNYRTGGRR